MSDEQKRQKRIQHIANNKGEKILTWKKKSKDDTSDPLRFKITLDADSSLTSAEFRAFEKKLAANNVAILEKFSNRFGRGLLVKGNDNFIVSLKESDDHIVDIVSPAPVASLLEAPKPWVQKIDSYGDRCTRDQAKRQISIADTVRGVVPENRTNFGQGSILVVWDQPFSNAQWPEYQKRRGGKPVINDMGASFGNHGSMVTSTCCGDAFGLASGAELGVVGMSSAVENVLAFIDKVIDGEMKKPASKQKAIVVNMSFKFDFSSRYQGGMEGVEKQTSAWRDSMDAMKKEYPRLAFINASGNDGIDVCEQDYGGNNANCSNCYSWPSFGHGKGYGVGDEAFVRIGATKAHDTNIPAEKSVTSYSNRGKCVHAYTYGNVCAFDAEKGGYYTTQGTSFAAPMFSSLVALAMTKNRRLTGDEAIQSIISEGRDSMQQGTFVTVDPKLLFLTSPDDGSGELSGSLAAADAEAKAGENALDSPPATTNTKIMYVFGFIAVAFLMFMMAKRYRYI